MNDIIIRKSPLALAVFMEFEAPDYGRVMDLYGYEQPIE